jgi:hypothetical protein
VASVSDYHGIAIASRASIQTRDGFPEAPYRYSSAANKSDFGLMIARAMARP